MVRGKLISQLSHHFSTFIKGTQPPFIQNTYLYHWPLSHKCLHSDLLNWTVRTPKEEVKRNWKVHLKFWCSSTLRTPLYLLCPYIPTLIEFWACSDFNRALDLKNVFKFLWMCLFRGYNLKMISVNKAVTFLHSHSLRGMFLEQQFFKSWKNSSSFSVSTSILFHT